MRALSIAVDFDETITRDTDLFVDMFEVMINHGHLPVIATAREYPGSDIGEFADRVSKRTGYNVNIVLTKEKAKMDVIKPDFWIDDWPLGITHGLVGHSYEPCREIAREIMQGR